MLLSSQSNGQRGFNIIQESDNGYGMSLWSCNSVKTLALALIDMGVVVKWCGEPRLPCWVYRQIALASYLPDFAQFL